LTTPICKLRVYFDPGQIDDEQAQALLEEIIGPKNIDSVGYGRYCTRRYVLNVPCERIDNRSFQEQLKEAGFRFVP
jgi:hypothetical protein